MDPIRRENEKNVGMLDMMIAFDTTGSMAQYIDAVRKDVAELIPQLFKDNEDLRLGIVAFGDYCDMIDAHTFGDAYQCLPLTDNANDLIRFVVGSKDTSGGDWPEFYELVLRKIIDETPWREGSTRSVLLIADAVPHEIGYTYADHKAAMLKREQEQFALKVDVLPEGFSAEKDDLSGAKKKVFWVWKKFIELLRKFFRK